MVPSDLLGGDLPHNAYASILATWRRTAQPAAERCFARLDGTAARTRSCEAWHNWASRRRTAPNEDRLSGEHRCRANGRNGLRVGTGKAGCKADGAPDTARPGNAGFILTIYLEVLYAFLSGEAQEPDDRVGKEPKSPVSAGPVHYVDLEIETAIDEAWHDDEEEPTRSNNRV